MYELSKAIMDDRLREAAHRREVRAVRRRQRAAALDRLRPLIEDAGSLALSDGSGWSRLRAEARIVTARLAAERWLPRHLVVSPDDAPALVTRTLVAAWRRLDRPRR